ncbi:MAG TPA: CsbD family protein [Mycobacteriales bacterium]|nr:CsbD family protein [Mycobacteriales bacterium]
MGLEAKIRNMTLHATGTVKQKVGRATKNKRLESEGRLDQTRSKVKKAGWRLRDMISKVVRRLRRR